MDRLFEAFDLKGLKIKNRICLPSCVYYGQSDEGGMATDAHVAHYRDIARGGAGLIIQEATCVSPHGKLIADQLGIWSDEQIPGHRRIVEAVHSEGVPILLQLHHAGVAGVEEGKMLCPSDFELMHRGIPKRGCEMTADEIEATQREFLNAAKRAEQAGYDGVELHGCHQYLISQFYNSRVNRRHDAYGKQQGLFALEIYDAIRKAAPESFVIGIRLGAFEPTLSDSIAHARELSEAGVDFIDVSYGFAGEDEPQKPEGFPYKDVFFAAGEIKKNVSCAVFAVNGIKSAQDARGVLELTGVDMVDIARGMLINPNWANDAQAGRDTGRCLDCPNCFWRSDPPKCPGRKKFAALCAKSVAKCAQSKTRTESSK
ncbi:MAG: NADH:flavin oxidoreductase [Eggerthellaceae bacterium]|nr:NADH:flavin oxidoreductase [Eggerthellaceae bacterium]